MCAKRQKTHHQAEHELHDRARCEEDGQADDGKLAEALEELKVVDAELVAEDELLHVVGELLAQLRLLRLEHIDPPLHLRRRVLVGDEGGASVGAAEPRRFGGSR